MPTDTPERRARRRLSLFLTFSGCILLMALPTALLPTTWMATMHRWLGLGVLTPSPLVEYLTRSASVLYAMHGGLMLLVARDVRRFADIIFYLAVAHLLFGVMMVFIDIHAGLPALWVALEGPVVIAAGALTWVLLRAVSRAS